MKFNMILALAAGVAVAGLASAQTAPVRPKAATAATKAANQQVQQTLPFSDKSDFDDAKRSDTDRYGALFRHLLERGIYVAPSQFECMFVSLAHSDEDIDRTVEAVGDFFA